jgi:solute carrier family 30 (zinc transporter), member 1
LNENDDGSDEKSAEIEPVNKIKNEVRENQKRHEKSLKNTFGWARVDILTMVICCTFLTSLCFSIVVEVIQTLFHINHHGDHMHHEEEYHLFTYQFCIILGALGLVLNGISYLLIGGYTYHQGSFLHLTSDGNVYILNRVDVDGNKLATPKHITNKSQKIHEMMRDTCSAFFVIVCSIIIEFCHEKDTFVVKMIDPTFSIISIIVLLTLSYPYSK